MGKMLQSLIPCLALLAATGLFQGVAASPPRCKCVPGDQCWPLEATWQRLDEKVGGNLIRTQPVAAACYPGPEEDQADCDFIVTKWPDQDFQTSSPVGRVLPYNVTCPPASVNHQNTSLDVPMSCSLGNSPSYAVNATTREDIKATLRFAQENNVRLVTTGTGHDLLGRSDGYGALEVWLKYYRNAIKFQKTYTSSTACTESPWKGSAIHIDGNFQWGDVSKIAKANNVIVATGGSVSVGAIGGWPSGGGHGPATSVLGLGSDQILEAEVLLADGQTVTANQCENPDLFRALRGGGPGYGIVLSMTVKAYPNVHVVTAHHLTLVPRAPANTSSLLDAVAVLLQQYPALIDAGVGGYTYWYNAYPTPVVRNSTSGYTHNVWTIGQDEAAARAALGPVVARLRQSFGAALAIDEDYATYPDYWSFYNTEMALNDPQGNTMLMSSRLIERRHVANLTAVRGAVGAISHAPGQLNSHCVLLTGGPKVRVHDAADPLSGLHPAWRRAAYGVVTIRTVPLHTSGAGRDAIEADMLAKGAVMKTLAPATGAYMNEAHRRDPDYADAFYGANYASHLRAKRKYDPRGVFYCPTCVGSEAFVDRPDGPLCRA